MFPWKSLVCVTRPDEGKFRELPAEVAHNAAPRPPAQRAKKNLFPTRSAATANASSEVEPYESPARDDADAMMTEVVTRAQRGEAEVIGDGSNLATIDVLASPPRSPSSDAIAAVVSAKRVLSRAKASRRLRQPGELRVNVLGCRVAYFIARRASLDAREEAEEIREKETP